MLGCISLRNELFFKNIESSSKPLVGVTGKTDKYVSK